MAQELDRDWLTLEQTAEYLQVSSATVTRWLKQGKLVGSQVVAGGKWRIKSNSIEKLLENTIRREI